MEVEFILITQLTRNIVVVLVRFSMAFVSRYQDPAYWRDGEVKDDIDYYSHELGEQPTILTVPTREGFPNGVICHVGKNRSGTC